MALVSYKPISILRQSRRFYDCWPSKGPKRNRKVKIQNRKDYELLIPSDFVVHSFRPPMEEAMSRLWSQLE
jgi:hypothetical protein